MFLAVYRFSALLRRTLVLKNSYELLAARCKLLYFCLQLTARSL